MVGPDALVALRLVPDDLAQLDRQALQDGFDPVLIFLRQRSQIRVIPEPISSLAHQMRSPFVLRSNHVSPPGLASLLTSALRSPGRSKATAARRPRAVGPSGRGDGTRSTWQQRAWSLRSRTGLRRRPGHAGWAARADARIRPGSAVGSRSLQAMTRRK